MFSYKIISCIAVFYILFHSPQSQAQDLSIRYVEAEDLWPFAYKNNGIVLGAYPEIVSRIFSTVNARVTTILYPDARGIFEVTAQRADTTTVILLGDLTIEDYPNTLTICPFPIGNFKLHVIWHKSIKIDPLQIYDLDQFNIGAHNTGRGFVEESNLFSEKWVKFQRVDGMMKSLIAQRVDGILLPWRFAQKLALSLDAEEKIQKGQFVGEINVHLAIANAWLEAHNLSGKVCPQIYNLHKSGVFDRILEKHYNEKRNTIKPPSIINRSSWQQPGK